MAVFVGRSEGIDLPGGQKRDEGTSVLVQEAEKGQRRSLILSTIKTKYFDILFTLSGRWLGASPQTPGIFLGMAMVFNDG